MLEKPRQRQFPGTCLHSIDGIAREIDCALECLGARPGAAAVGESSKVSCNNYNGCVASAPSREGHDMIVTGAGGFERLVVAVREDVGELVAQSQEMCGPGELEITIAPVLGQGCPVRCLQRGKQMSTHGKIRSE